MDLQHTRWPDARNFAVMVGEELYNARLDAGLTQDQLHYASGVDRSYISQLENNKWSPSLDVLFKLCKALGITASELIARVEAKQKPQTPRAKNK